MKNIIKLFMCAAVLAAAVISTAQNAAALQRVEDDNFSVTSKLPTQYVLYTLAGSTGATAVYYRVTAVVGGGIGEIKPSALTVSDANAVRSSTNTLRIRWATVIGASSYNIYRSTTSSSADFLLLDNVTAHGDLSLLDYGQAAGAAYVAPDPRGGNLEVENDVSVGGDMVITGDLTVTGTLSPYTTGTFTADDASLTYGVGAATGVFTGAVTVGGALGVTGATSGTTLAMSGAAAILGAVELGAENTQSTMTAAGVLSVHTSVTAPAVSGTTSITGGAISGTTLAMSGAAAILGAVELGAENTQSTMTAAGVLSVHTSVTAPAISGTTSITGGAISGTTLAMSGAGAVLGAVELGAENTQSTMTAAGVMTVYASVTAPTIVASSIMRIPSLTLAVIMAKTAVMGDIFICNDCSPVEVAISTAAGAPNTGGYGNAAGAQLD